MQVLAAQRLSSCLKHAVKGKEEEDIVSYISAISNFTMVLLERNIYNLNPLA
jgi:hypothetical protein